MPKESTIAAARKDAREGKAATTQGGEFVREEMHHVRESEHGAKSPEQAIAIGLSKARRAGVDVPPKQGSPRTKAKAKTRGNGGTTKSAKRPSPKRSAASKRALKSEGRTAASRSSLSKHATKAASQRTAKQRSDSAKKGAKTRARLRK
jgi:hypothetical protein